MATILGQLRVYNALYLSIDGDPTAGAGVQAGIGSMAVSPDGKLYEKTGAGDTSWTLRASPGASSVAVQSMVFVAKNGDDATGDGSLSKPYLTVKKAMDSILTATNLNRFAIMVGPGRYTEVGLTLKANVFVVGMSGSYFTTRIQNNVAITLDADFNVANDIRSGFYNINLATPALNIDFNAVSSNEGKIYFRNCQMTGGATFTPFSSINQVTIDDCHIFGAINLNACNSQLGNNYFEGVGLNYVGVVGKSAALVLLGNNIQGAVSIDGTLGTANVIELGNNKLNSTLSINNAIVSSDVASLPVKANITLLGTGAITRLNDAFGLGYTPTTVNDWAAPVPASVQAALDRLASLNVREPVIMLTGGDYSPDPKTDKLFVINDVGGIGGNINLPPGVDGYSFSFGTSDANGGSYSLVPNGTDTVDPAILNPLWNTAVTIVFISGRWYRV